MKSVTVDEIIELLEDSDCPSADSYLRSELIKRIKAHGIAPPEGYTIVTCVYCGHEYQDGTPSAKCEALTEHIKLCNKHPMREAERKIDILLNALKEIDEWTNRYTTKGHPISTFAQRAIYMCEESK